MISVGDRTIGGYLATPEGVPPQAHWLTHLQVADVRAVSKRVKEELGGTIMKPAFAVGDFGTMAVVIDPHGAAFALWQPAKAEPDAAPADNTFCWNELASAAPEASVAFYTKIGGTTSKGQDMGPMGTYHVLSSADEVPRAGIMKQMMPQQPHAWLPYVQVANPDAAFDRIDHAYAELILDDNSGPRPDTRGSRSSGFAFAPGSCIGKYELGEPWARARSAW